MKRKEKKQYDYDNVTPLEHIANIRGIDDYREFLNPSRENLHDPYLMKNISDVADRIIYAIQHEQNIVVGYDP